MATCGPTNAATQMSKLVNSDKSHQLERANAQSIGGGLRDFKQLSANDMQRFEQITRPDPFSFDKIRMSMPGAPQAPQVLAPQAPQAPVQTHQAPQAPQMHAPSAQMQAPQTHHAQNWAQEFSMPQPVQMHQMQPMMSMPMMSMQPMHNRFMPMERVVSQDQLNSQWDAEFAKLDQGVEAKGAETEGAQEVQEAEVQEGAQDSHSTTHTTTETPYTGRLMTEQEEEELNRSYTLDALDHAYPPNWDEMWENINTASTHTQPFQTNISYKFEEDNPFKQEEDPYEMGVFYMDNGAKLSTAVLCFEEAVRRDPRHVEAWARLGMAQAQNEVEDQAIVALEKAIQLNPMHDRALLNLAISYTNEGYDAAASQLLNKWITFKYPAIAESFPPLQDQSVDLLHQRVTKMFLKAALQTQLDADVQVGLGVLCYKNDDYIKAIDCFKTALSLNENDPSLWNRLGATLANASRPEEAIEAYERALQLRPSFVRARYNLAVSCINIGCYKEATEHLLSALALHETEESKGVDMDASASLVDTLRRVFFAMDRRDLLVNLQQGMSLDVFRGEFNF